MKRIAFVYDPLPELASVPGELPEDAGAEYEEPGAVAAILASIAANGFDAVGVPFDEARSDAMRELAPDLVFNIAEGVRGPARESLIPAWLDHLGIPCTGSDGLTLALALDKAWTKEIAAARGVATPPFLRAATLEEVAACELPFPLFVKPNAEGSSMGVRRESLVETRGQLLERAAWVLENYREDCLIETFLPGREFAVGLLGAGPDALPIAEIETGSGFYAYEDKSTHRKRVTCPARIDAETAEEMIASAWTVFRALRCRDFARVDFKLDAAGRPAFLEINPLPGLAPGYGIFPMQAAAAGLSHVEMIGSIIRAALDRAAPQKERSL